MELNVSAELAKIIGTKKGEKISRPQVRHLRSFLSQITTLSLSFSVSRGSGPTWRRRNSRIPRTSSGSLPMRPWLRSLVTRRSSASVCPSTWRSISSTRTRLDVAPRVFTRKLFRNWLLQFFNSPVLNHFSIHLTHFTICILLAWNHFTCIATVEPLFPA